MKLPAGVAIAFGFVPYLAFFLVARTVSNDAGLWAAAAVTVASAGRNYLRTRSLKLLEIGNLVLFVGLAGFTTAVHFSWSVTALRLAVDLGLLLIALTSLAIGQPFTLQYARERAPESYWRSPVFLRVNRNLTAAWTAAFAVLVAAHAAVLVVPGFPLWLDVVATIAALGGALGFTTRYPARVQRRAGIIATAG
jgi:hypothetical protein